MFFKYVRLAVLVVLCASIVLFGANRKVLSVKKECVLPPLTKKACELIRAPSYPSAKWETMTLVERAASFMQSHGPTAIDMIHNNVNHQWFEGQFYIMVVNASTKTLIAAPSRRSLRGMYLGDIGTTLDNKSLLSIVSNIQRFPNGVWQHFYWRIPGTRDVAMYNCFGKLVRTDYGTFVVMSGYYDDEGRCDKHCGKRSGRKA